MNFLERWRLAGVIAAEVRFEGYLDANPTNRARIKEQPTKAIERLKRSTRVVALIMAIAIASLAISTLAAVSPLNVEVSLELRLTLAISFFLGLSFIIVFFMNLIVSNGFYSSGAMLLPSILPLSRRSVENLYLLAFARIFTPPALAIITIFPLGCLLVFGPLLALIALVACATTILLAIGSLISVSKWFHKKSYEADESRASTIIRVGVSLGMVIGMFSAYSAASVLPSLTNLLIVASETIGEIFLVVLSPIFPFSFGIIGAVIALGFVFHPITIIVASGASILYIFLAIRSYLRSGREIKSIALGGVSVTRSGPIREIRVETLTPISAIIKKDMNLSTRNISSIALFVLPVMMVFSILPTLSMASSAGIRSMTALTVVAYATAFSGLVIIGLLMLDTQGASIHEGLPLSTKDVLSSKVRMFMIPYIFSMVLIAVILIMNTLISPYLVCIPIFQIAAAFAVGSFSCGIMFKWRGDGRAVGFNPAGDQIVAFVVLGISGIIGGIPLVSYGAILLLTGNHLLSVLAQLLVAFVESILAWYLVPRLLKE